MRPSRLPTRLSAAIGDLVLLAAFTACGGQTLRPVAVDPSTMCANCRMAVSDPRHAAQLLAPAEDPQFFDDIGCLAAAVRRTPPPRGAVAYVADHRTGQWVRAADATYTFVRNLATPMGSHLLAHADAASRSQDPDAVGGTPRTAADVFGAGDIAGAAHGG